MPYSVDNYEKNIPPAHRLQNGQYYTPSFLCDLILGLCLKPGDSRLLEPSCGTGAFLQRAMDWIAQSQPAPFAGSPFLLHGIEVDPQAAKLALAQLTQASTMATRCQIQTADFLSPDIHSDALGRFDVIVGNPPYVRQERMAQSATLDKPTALASLRQKYADYLRAWPAQEALFSQTTDLYIWFFLQATTLLKPGGRLAFITSNSWLNTAYGQAFRQFLHHHFRIHYLVESACERWFPDAAINAIIIVLEKKPAFSQSDSFDDDTVPVNIVRFLQPLQHWLPPIDSPMYWTQLDQRIQQFANDPGIEYKCFSIKQLETRRTNWALPLRAPLTLTHLLETPELWRPLDKLGTVRYPIKTGINRFFYISRTQAAQWKVESEFLFPAIRSARNIQRYAIHAHDCDEFLFACTLSKSQLNDEGKTGALAYIEWGEQQTAPPRQKRTRPIPWPEVTSVKSSRPAWHAIQPIPAAHILCNRFVDRRFFFALCQGEVIEDQTFYGLTLPQPDTISPAFIAALLNSSLSFLLLELNGRTSLGEGVLQFARCDMAALPVLNPDLFSTKEQQAIADHFHTMLQRPIFPLPDELQQADRIALDRLVYAPMLRHLGFSGTTDAFREQWLGPLLNRVAERHALARSVKQNRNR